MADTQSTPKLARQQPTEPDRAAGSAGAPTTLGANDLMARVRRIQIRTHRLVDDALAGAYHSTFRGSGIEFDEVRPYEAGDDVRTIDWKRTAREEQPFVKKYVEERELSVELCVDTSRSMDFGTRESSKRELAAQFCALIAFVAQRHQDRVGLRLFGSEMGLHLVAAKGGGAVSRLVREVIAAEPTDGRADYAHVLEQARRTLRRRSFLLLVSDFADVHERREWSDRLVPLARRHDVVLVRVVDPFEEELPDAGVVLLSDVESGELREVDTGSKRVRAAWAEAARRRKAAFDELRLRAGVDAIELSTARDVAAPVIQFFKQRRRRRGNR